MTTKSKRAAKPLCGLHRAYKAVRKPVVPCHHCWNAWLECNPQEPIVAKDIVLLFRAFGLDIPGFNEQLMRQALFCSCMAGNSDLNAIGGSMNEELLEHRYGLSPKGVLADFVDEETAQAILDRFYVFASEQQCEEEGVPAILCHDGEWVFARYRLVDDDEDEDEEEYDDNIIPITGFAH